MVKTIKIKGRTYTIICGKTLVFIMPLLLTDEIEMQKYHNNKTAVELTIRLEVDDAKRD